MCLTRKVQTETHESANGGDFKKSCQILNNMIDGQMDSQKKLDEYNYLVKGYQEKYGIISNPRSNSVSMDFLGYLEAQIDSDGKLHVT